MPRRPLLPVAIAIAALLLSACGGDEQRRGADITTPEPTVTTKAEVTSTTASGTATSSHGGMTLAKKRITIVGRNIAFSPDKLTIAVNEEVDVTFDNRDAAVPHNIHFLTPKDVKTDVKNGKADGVKDRFKLKVDKTGTYDFLCDVHPAMKGELTVS